MVRKVLWVIEAGVAIVAALNNMAGNALGIEARFSWHSIHPWTCAVE